VDMVAADRWTESPGRLAWSEGWRPLGALYASRVNSCNGYAMMTPLQYKY